MSAEPVEPPRSRDFRDASPSEVRAALIPEERAEFDEAWRRVTSESQDLAKVTETLDSWRRIAWMTASGGPEAHRRMWRRAAALHTGEEIPDDEPFSVTKARLGY